ncbi:hypothetical protein QA089_003012 [Meyerozyma guilliermondii]
MTSTSHDTIQALNPDFMLAVSHPTKKGHTTYDAESNMKSLAETLDNAGFYLQVRPGSDANEILVFIKLSSYKYAEELEKDLIQNYEFGVPKKEESRDDKLRIVHQYLTSPDAVGGIGITPGKGDWSFVKSITPVTSAFEESHIADDLKTHIAGSTVDVHDVKESHGVQVALYFEFVQFYLYWLAGLAVVGLISYFVSKHTFSLSYTCINLLWGTFFISLWKRRENFITNKWGVVNCHLVEEHKEELARLNKNYEEKSSYKHKGNGEAFLYLKELGFIPIALGFTIVLVSYQLLCFVLEIFLTEIYDGPGVSLLALLPTILISVFVPILTIIYNFVTDKVLIFESHPTSYSKNNSVLIKSYVLTFLTSYMPLLITSFIYLPFAHLVEPHLGDIKYNIATRLNENRFYYKYMTAVKRQEDFKINQNRLNAQFFFFVVTSQVIQLVMKYVLPIVLPKIKALISKKEPFNPQDDEEEHKWLENARKISTLPAYNVNDDFRGIAVQYGYLIMFGPVWSLAPLVSVFFVLLTLKLDELKLSNGKYFRPPVPERVDCIHPWNLAFFGLTWLGSVVSPLITVFYRHGTQPPKTLGQLALDKASVHASPLYMIFVLFASEHTFFILYFLLSKLATLFRSETEWENDFVDNDLKLRHDYYTEKVKPNYEPKNDGDWTKYTASDAIAQAKNIGANVSEQVEDKGQSTSYQKSSGVASGVSSGAVSRGDKGKREYEKLQETLRQKELELQRAREAQENERLGLEKSKDGSDSIIQTKSNEGEVRYSTIDDNSHADEDTSKLVGSSEDPTTKQTGSGAARDYEQDDSQPSSSVVSSYEEGSSSSNGAKSAKKKNSLKKLLRKAKKD